MGGSTNPALSGGGGVRPIIGLSDLSSTIERALVESKPCGREAAT